MYQSSECVPGYSNACQYIDNNLLNLLCRKMGRRDVWWLRQRPQDFHQEPSVPGMAGTLRYTLQIFTQ